jgi:hypothetical protein
MPLKVVCPNDKEHKRFEVTAHVAELWEVDENADFVDAVTTLDVLHRPGPDDYYTCIICGADCTVKLVKEEDE